MNTHFFHKEKKREYDYKYQYNITIDEYDNLYRQQKGSCKICSKNFPRLYVDHDHNSGKVRGLLCHNCNLVLGHAFDNTDTLSNAIEYLRDHGSTDQVNPR